jgi:hypothetical protein
VWEIRNAYKILVKNLKGREHLADPDTGGRIINGVGGLSWIHLAKDMAQ